MKQNINRRDFLKLSTLTGGAYAAQQFAPAILDINEPATPHILIFVFDAMSAENLSLYGYPRITTPNLERLASRSNVYHNHHSGGNFTTPGTASLLTGSYPWTHRAFNYSGLIRRDLVQQNIFNMAGAQYNKIAFSQNLWPNYFFDQFSGSIDETMRPGSFSAIDPTVGSFNRGDLSAGYRSLDEFFLLMDHGSKVWPSLLLGPLDRVLLEQKLSHLDRSDYPHGLPTSNIPIFYRLQDVVDGLISKIKSLSSPGFCYFHLMAPHNPYSPTKKYDELFKADRLRFKDKPNHRYGDKTTKQKMLRSRAQYDSYIANLDADFGKLLDTLEQNGILHSNYVIITADHGDMFERGVIGHTHSLLFEPVTHIPLIISTPGQNSRRDFYTTTNSVDILPTLAQITGSQTSFTSEGMALPGFQKVIDAERSTFVVEAKSNSAFAPLRAATIAMYKSNYKLIYYTGYAKGADLFELYDLSADRDEMNDLYSLQPSQLKPMKDELLEKLNSVNLPYL